MTRMTHSGIKRKLVDRRDRPRFEIVGQLWGSIETVLGVTLANVSQSGALVRSAVSLPTGSEHHVTISAQGVQAPTKVRVRHVRPALANDGRREYIIGLEFLTIGPVLEAHIQQWLHAAGGAVGL